MNRLSSPLAVALATALSATLGTSLARAQGQLPDVAPLGGGPTPTQSSPKAPPGAPETHAASGGDTSLPTGNEPALPEQPLSMSPATAAKIGADADPESLGTTGDVERSFYGLYFSEKAQDYRYQVLFPLWAERTKPSLVKPEIVDRASVYGGLYYQRRSADAADDVLFPLVWNLRNPLEESRSTIVGPFVNRRTKTETDDWLAPLYMTGTRADGGYTIIPPLLTGLTRDEKGGLNIVGPAFCSWTVGPDCDTRTARDIDLGIVPFYFYGQNEDRLYEVIPPLLHYYSYRERTQGYVNIYGPYYREHTEKREMLHLLPFSYNIWGENERHTTILPLFHYGFKGKENLLVTPFFVNRNDEEGAHTFVTWLYARHRGRTELDMVTPLYWNYRDPSIGLDRKLFFPFLYTNTSPREATTTFFPFYSHSERYGISDSLWVTPLFNLSHHTRGWSTSLLPIAFFGKDGNSSHSVLAPLFFDFATPKTRSTFALPFYYRQTDLENTMQIVGNFLYQERRFKNGRDWQFHILPLFSYGESPDGHFWNLLFGFTGFTRSGQKTTLRALWIPIPLSQ